MKNIIRIQFFVLLIGTVFAWTNFLNELFAWLNNQPCETGCSAAGEVVNPFLTPCFYGAVFFALAFILSIMLMIGKGKKEKPDAAVESAPANDNVENVDGQ